MAQTLTMGPFPASDSLIWLHSMLTQRMTVTMIQKRTVEDSGCCMQSKVAESGSMVCSGTIETL